MHCSKENLLMCVTGLHGAQCNYLHLVNVQGCSKKRYFNACVKKTPMMITKKSLLKLFCHQCQSISQNHCLTCKSNKHKNFISFFSRF